MLVSLTFKSPFQNVFFNAGVGARSHTFAMLPCSFVMLCQWSWGESLKSWRRKKDSPSHQSLWFPFFDPISAVSPGSGGWFQLAVLPAFPGAASLCPETPAPSGQHPCFREPSMSLLTSFRVSSFQPLPSVPPSLAANCRGYFPGTSVVLSGLFSSSVHD